MLRFRNVPSPDGLGYLKAAAHEAPLLIEFNNLKFCFLSHLNLSFEATSSVVGWRNCGSPVAKAPGKLGEKMIITIDGPVGSGKSYVARELAKRLDIYYLNTGLLYRAVGYIWTQILNKKVEDIKSITEQDLEFVKNISYEYRGEKPHIFYDNKDLTASLFEAAIDKPASILSAVPEVRAALLQFQRDLAKKYDLVAEGRDCGSVVFPQADYKFFLTADVQTRVERILTDEKRCPSRRSSKVPAPQDDRVNEQALEKVKEELEDRDRRDKSRKISPLAVPDDAIIIDSSNMDKEETIKKFLQYIKK